jgi:hypothetical protein
VIQPGYDGSVEGGVTQQQAAAAADVEQAVLGLQIKRAQDRAASEVVHVVGAVHRPGACAGGATRDAVGQPVGEPILRQQGGTPSCEPFVAESEAGDRLLRRAVHRAINIHVHKWSRDHTGGGGAVHGAAPDRAQSGFESRSGALHSRSGPPARPVARRSSQAALPA